MMPSWLTVRSCTTTTNGSTTTPLVHEDGSVQILTTIADASAPRVYEYPLDIPLGSLLTLTADGGAEVATSDGLVIVSVAAPWAYDAEGRAVPTHFEVEGGTLLQIVNHVDGQTAYPVVADPSVSFGWYVYVKYSKADVRRYWSGTQYLNQAAAAAACAAVASAYGAAVCGSLTAGYFESIGSTFKDAKKYNQCVEVAMTYVGGIPVKWKRYSC